MTLRALLQPELEAQAATGESNPKPVDPTCVIRLALQEFLAHRAVRDPIITAAELCRRQEDGVALTKRLGCRTGFAGVAAPLFLPSAKQCEVAKT